MKGVDLTMSLQDALYNWLCMKVVHDARPGDSAAEETCDFFRSILEKEHLLTQVEASKEKDMYSVTFVKDEEKRHARFPIDLIECILNSIEENPERYKSYEV
ncbi:hypothetical protein [Bacillus sp. 1P06AnD]|uniref:hypothetical protein n=1 Tax=Bacillus sp. 1P06AnD TaxID=3132208 RepID=UPI0039A268F8